MMFHNIHSYQAPTSVSSCFTTKDTLESIDLIPMFLLAPRLVDAIPMHKILQVLFDSGGFLSLMNEWVMPQGIPLSNETSQLIQTMILPVTYSSHASVILHDIILPKSNRSAYILQQKCQVFKGLCTFDAILGRDFLCQVGLTMHCFCK